MRANRLLSILLLLQSRGRLTAQALAEEFEVSVRTVYRDIDELSAAGVPVYADRGPGGGFALLDGYRTRLTGMTAGEAETLLLAGLPGPAADLGLAEPLATARLKLLAAVPQAAGEGAARVGDRFHLDPVDWYRRAEPPPHLPAIARAVWGQRRLVIRYESWSATVRRTVDPLGLVLKAGAWYLMARIGDDIRTYKVAKVLDLDVLPDGFDYPAGFDLAAQWRESLRRFARELRRAEAVLRVSPEALPLIDRLGADAAEAVLQAPPDAEGRRQATVPIEGVGHAARLLLGFTDLVEVLEPPELRQALAEGARRVAALYPG
ncbi:helix-turn-helix transcriptional regulator [Inquilinus limosus]|uniref:Transcriptional regulator n=1 Tax=Inquilinus limosus TaxID=171674 RepID=A0A211ZIP8_9PROT|nr:WYL domain-containing protein [Inquilinus limosus]OWJ65123.1 transcriptional regulator [Inquilinus limosus]